MVLQIQLPPETEARLLERAAETGKNLQSLILEAVEERLGFSDASPAAADTLSTEQWSKEWHAWTIAHRTLDYNVDDSREGIYAGRGA